MPNTKSHTQCVCVAIGYSTFATAVMLCVTTISDVLPCADTSNEHICYTLKMLKSFPRCVRVN